MYEDFFARQEAELEATEAQRLLPRQRAIHNWPGPEAPPMRHTPRAKPEKMRQKTREEENAGAHKAYGVARAEKSR